MRTIFGILAVAGGTVIGMAQSPVKGAFVAMLGNDTLFVESYRSSSDLIIGTIVQKLPRAIRVQYTVRFGSDGAASSVEHTTRAVNAAPSAPPLLQRTATIADSVVTSDVVRNGVRDSAASGQLIVAPGALPWLANSLALWERLLQQARRMPGDSVRIDQFYWGKDGRDRSYVKKLSATEFVASWFDYPTHDWTDAAGLLQKHDATQTTTKMIATRVTSLDIDAIASTFAASEQNGASMQLSVRDTVRTVIAGAAIQIDYGRPLKRGRTIWGEVVPWNAVWRTGANAATQISTSANLQFGSTMVPAGKYTLWSLPTPKGMQLILNKQTGQWGTEYDAAKDHARVEMTVSASSEPVDQFTISCESSGVGGILRMAWDNRQATIPFVVK